MLRTSDHRPRKVITIITLLATALYVVLSVSQLYGVSHFYSPIEHVLFVLYGVSSFFTCLWATKHFVKTAKVNYSAIVKVIVISGVGNAIITTIIFLLTRKIFAVYLQLEDWWPPLSGIVANIIYTFFVIHLIIGALYLSYIVLQLNHEAALKQFAAEKDKANTQLKLLQQQFSPHFLFNNLNVLASLIPVDAKLAEQYVTQFASLYRFIIKFKDDDLILLRDELDFTEQYIRVMNIRFDNAYVFSLTTGLMTHSKVLIAPGALQSCVENAIKHNTASSKKPLDIVVDIRNDVVTIENAKRLKKHSVETTKTGINNLLNRYQSLNQSAVLVEQSADYFKVTIPLIDLINEEEMWKV